MKATTIEIARNLVVDAVEYASRANAILGIREKLTLRR